eukprot:1558178-Rhodomonas_salina.2
MRPLLTQQRPPIQRLQAQERLALLNTAGIASAPAPTMRLKMNTKPSSSEYVAPASPSSVSPPAIVSKSLLPPAFRYRQVLNRGR